jgi:hypothetical protein
MKTVIYSHSGQKYEAAALDDLGEFIEMGRLWLDEGGAVRLILEPGDGTRYEFIVAGPIVLAPGQRTYALCYMNDHSSFAIHVAPDAFTVPGYVAEHADRDVNPHTAAVAADLINLLRDTDRGRMFKLGLPEQEVLRGG